MARFLIAGLCSAAIAAAHAPVPPELMMVTGMLTADQLVSFFVENNSAADMKRVSLLAGLYFPDERTGVRAHVRHLKAFGSTEPLVGRQVDPRYGYVTPKGKSPDILGLACTWAADRECGRKLAGMLEKLFI
jgi:hypothetical protein